MLKRNDIILIIALIIVCGVLFFVFSPKHSGNTVVILENNTELYRLPINEDREIELAHNKIVIKNNSVYMEKADCPDKICVNHKKIQVKNESIICLPNGIVVEVE